MQERDLVSARARSWMPIQKRYAPLGQLIQRALDVLDGKGDVMEAAALI